MKKTTLVLMLLMILSGLFGFVRDIVLSYYYGATNISDAYLISLTIPTTIGSLVMMGIATGYIPLFTSIVNKKGEKEGLNFTNNLVNLIIVISTITVLLTVFFAKEVVWIFASGFTGETLQMAVLFTRVSIVGLYFSSLTAVLTAYMQIKERYLLPAVCGILAHLLIVFFMLLSFRVNLIFLPLGSVIAFIIQSYILFRAARKYNYYYNFKLNLKDESIRKIIILSLPLVVGVAFNQVNIVIDRTLASNITEGGISALTYSSRIHMFIESIVITSIGTVMFPIISNLSATKDMEKLKKVIRESIIMILLFIVPASIGILLFSKPIIELLYQRGAYTDEAVYLTSSALFYYTFGMVGIGLRDIFAKVFYSLQDTKTPMINGTLAVIVNIFLNIVLSKYMGIGGLALATSISAILCSLLLGISLKKKIGFLGMREVYILAQKILFASLIMAIGAKLSFIFISGYWSSNVSLIIAIFVGIVVYSLSIFFMKIEDVHKIVIAIKTNLIKKLRPQTKAN